MNPKEIREKMGQAHTQARAIHAKAAAEKREMTAEEQSKFDALYNEYDTLQAQLTKLEASAQRDKRMADAEAAMNASQGRSTSPGSTGQESRAGEPFTIEFRGRKLTVQPGSPEHVRSLPQYREAALDYYRNANARGMSISSDIQGGYLTTTQFATDLIKFVDDEVQIRKLATVMTLGQAVSLGVPSWDTDPGDADWTAEVPSSDLSEDDSARVGGRNMIPHLFTKLVKISTALLQAAVIDPEQLLLQRLGYKFAVTEEKAYLTGSGAQRPLGLFTASDQGISTSRDVSTSNSTTAIAADNLFECFYTLKPQYQAVATWLFHRDAIKQIRKLKDSQNQYLWQPGLAGGQPNTILDRPYVQCENAPNTFTASQYVGIVGDFKKYWIVDSMQITIQRLAELFALKNQVGFVGRKMTDGAPVLEEAFVRVKLAAS